MARAIYRINEFIGIDQSRDENALKSAMSPDACNMDTADGELTVAKRPYPARGIFTPYAYFQRRTGKCS